MRVWAALAAATALAPMSAFAEHMDVIGFEMTGQCTMAEFMQIVGDFNRWGEEHGYHAKVAAPLQSDDLTTYYWLGTSANAAAFGAAWDARRDALPDAKSTPAKLWARLQKCSKNTRRDGYDVF
jgi:hypothetical protein